MLGRRRLHPPRGRAGPTGAGEAAFPHPFRSAVDLLARGDESGLTIAQVMRANEAALRPPAEVEAHVARAIAAMFACVDRGLSAEGELPGGLKVKRRAKAIHERLRANATRNARAAHEIMDFVSVYALAVNEENAAGGRVLPDLGRRTCHRGRRPIRRPTARVSATVKPSTRPSIASGNVPGTALAQ